MFTISKQFTFSAAHELTHLPQEHSCNTVHGHNYVVTVFARAEMLNKQKMVLDYYELSFIKNYIDKHLDHTFLNDKFGAITAEYLAYYLCNLFRRTAPQIYAVEVSETPKTNARYEI